MTLRRGGAMCRRVSEPGVETQADASEAGASTSPTNQNPSCAVRRAFAFHPVDTRHRRRHSAAVSKKPQKVEETAAPYAAKKATQPAAPATKKAEAEDREFHRITGKLFKERKELLHKLAQ